MTSLHQAVFFDKDGTLVEDVPYNVDCAKVRLVPGAIEAARQLSDAGYLIVIVSNQSGVARGFFTIEAVYEMERYLRQLLAEQEIPLAGFYFCPHHPQGTVPLYAQKCAC